MTNQGGKSGRRAAGASKAGATPVPLAADGAGSAFANEAGGRRDMTGTVRRLSALLEASRTRLSHHATAEELDRLTGDLDRARRELGAVSGENLAAEERLGIVRAAREARARLAVLAKLAHGGARFASLVRELDPAGRTPALYGRDGGATVGGATVGGATVGGATVGGATVGGRKSGNGRGGIERKV